VKLVNQRTAEFLKFANDMGIELEKAPRSRLLDDQIEAQHQQMEAMGFAPLMLFRPGWLERLNT
ncbi:hypothetical protein KW792_02400, partial [Candidatus Saccharibacteria bacterium]|nr:hypothetical protein [Candidatus Saccharibacteria bacterium]